MQHRTQRSLLTSALMLALAGCVAVQPQAPGSIPEAVPATTRATTTVLEPLPRAPADTAAAPMVNRPAPARFLSGQQLYGSLLDPGKRPQWLKDCVTERDLDQPLRSAIQPAPEYTTELAEQGVQGRVRLLYEITPDGKLGRYVLLNVAHPALLAISVQAMQRWTFARPTHRGLPVTACHAHSLNYQP